MKQSVCKKDILLIDDDDDELEIFTMALNDLNIAYNCSCARDAQQAMKMLSNGIPDLIFIDVNMPGINGIQCLKEIKQIKALEKVPVIIYSTCVDELTCKTAMDTGAMACIKKTSSINSLTGILKKVFDRHSVVDPYPVFHRYG